MLEIKDLHKSFGDNHVLKGVSFSVEKGDVLTILGKNGSGKTTIINIILKLINKDKGDVMFHGKEIKRIANRKYFSEIGAVLESSDNVYDFLTGRDNINYFAGFLGINLKAIKEKVDGYIRLFELGDSIDKKVGTYSRGMYQKLAIIISLLSSPRLLILDEPTLGLDIESKNLMINILKDIVKQEGIGIILTTHQMDVVEKIGGKVMMLKNGKSTCYDSLDKIARRNESEHIIYYRKDGEINTFIERGMTILSIAKKYENLDIVEIKLNQNLDEIIMEELNEFD